MPRERQRLEDGREALQPRVAAEHAAVEPHVRRALLAHPPHDRLGDDVAGREVGQRVLVRHEAPPGVVEQDRALAAHRLGHQRLLPLGQRAEPHHRRVELDELEVGDRAPARSASATPSPVDTYGLVVWPKTWPKPPVARTTARRERGTDAVALPRAHDVQGDPLRRAGRRRAAGRGRARSRPPRCPGRRRTAATSAREISAPVASPPACAMRSRRCPPSRVSAMAPLASTVEVARRWRSARARRPGPRSPGSARPPRRTGPTPATRVSCRCSSGESSSESAAAMPPCAQRVEPSLTCALVTSRTRSPDRPGAQRGGEPGDPGADDDDVGARDPARLGGRRADAGRGRGPWVMGPPSQPGCRSAASTPPWRRRGCAPPRLPGPGRARDR